MYVSYSTRKGHVVNLVPLSNVCACHWDDYHTVNGHGHGYISYLFTDLTHILDHDLSSLMFYPFSATDPDVVQGFKDFVNANFAEDFYFEFNVIVRDVSPEPGVPLIPGFSNPVVFNSRAEYLDEDSGIVAVSNLFGTLNLNGGSFGAVKCDPETNTASLIVRTLDFIFSGTDIDGNGRQDNTISMGRNEVTFSYDDDDDDGGSVIFTRLIIRDETYGTIQFDFRAFGVDNPV
jgi:hypothetical protein